MNRNKEIKKELEEIAPMLGKLKDEKSSFRVPENYFQDMQEDVFSKLNTVVEEEKVPSFWEKFIIDSIATLQLLLQPKPILRLAAVALVITAGVYIFQKGPQAGGQQEYLADISSEEVMEYVNDNIDDFELADVVEAADINGEGLYSVPEIEDEISDEYLDEIIDDFEIEELEEML